MKTKLLILSAIANVLLVVLYLTSHFSTSEQEDLSLISWNNCISQLNFDADIVFIGDSLTCYNNFQESFPDKQILNLGLSGDSLQRINERCDLIPQFTPEKIFIEGGINSLKKYTPDELIAVYDELITKVKTNNPNTEIYIQNILPISFDSETEGRTNKNVNILNTKLNDLCLSQNVNYIDLNSIYSSNGEMNAEYTKDGVHLKDEYKYLWIDAISKYIN